MNQLELGMVSLREAHEVSGGVWADLWVARRALVLPPVESIIEAVMYAARKMEATYITVSPSLEGQCLIFTMARADKDKPLTEEALRDWLRWFFGGACDKFYPTTVTSVGRREQR